MQMNVTEGVMMMSEIKREYENAIAIIEELYDAHSEASGVPADIIAMTKDEIIKALEEAVE